MATSADIVRGTTVNFATTFYDASGAITEPTGAALCLAWLENGALANTEIEMTAPASGSSQWTAEWDSRGIPAGTVWWSIHSEASGIPFVVEDGTLALNANRANPETF